MYENVCSSSLHIHEMKIGTKIMKFKASTQVTNITFFFPTHTYRAIQNTLNNCVNISCVWVWNLITFEKATWPNTFFMTNVLQINSLITINVIKSTHSKPVLVIKGNSTILIFSKAVNSLLSMSGFLLNYFSKFSYQICPLW